MLRDKIDDLLKMHRENDNQMEYGDFLVYAERIIYLSDGN